MNKSKLTIICLIIILTIIIILFVTYCAVNYISFDNSATTSENNSAEIYYDGQYYVVN